VDEPALGIAGRVAPELGCGLRALGRGDRDSLVLITHELDRTTGCSGRHPRTLRPDRDAYGRHPPLPG
jgi:hypothetical protein